MNIIELTKTLIENINGILLGLAGLLVAIKGIIEAKKAVKKTKEKKHEIAVKQELQVKANRSIQGYKIRGEIRRTLRKLINQYKLLNTDILRFHNSGDAIAPINSKLKVTIEYEQFMETEDGEIIPGLNSKKDEWQSRQIDANMELFIEDMLIDKIMHLKDLTSSVPNAGIRQIYSTALGKELLFIEIGFIGYDYLVLAIHREHRNKSLSVSNKNDIEYYIKDQANNILEMIKSTKY